MNEIVSSARDGPSSGHQAGAARDSTSDLTGSGAANCARDVHGAVTGTFHGCHRPPSRLSCSFEPAPPSPPASQALLSELACHCARLHSYVSSQVFCTAVHVRVRVWVVIANLGFTGGVEPIADLDVQRVWFCGCQGVIFTVPTIRGDFLLRSAF